MRNGGAPHQQSPRWRSAAELPEQLAGAAVEVYVNGVRQQEGRDYRREGRRLLFERPLAREGRLGLVRWASMFFGVAGTYRQNDTVDVAYELRGRRLVESGLPIEPAAK